MDFLKYQQRGAYHWTEYDRGGIYKKHVDLLKEWVKGNDILDIGAGDGLITAKLGALGIDDNQLAVKLAKEKGVNVELGDAYALPDKKFDTVIMADVLEHLEFPDKAINEVKKVLKGNFYIVTPPARDDGKVQDPYHYKEYKPEELKEYIESFGFKHIETIIKPDWVRMYALFSNK